MIAYTFEFEEKEDGSFRIDYKSPASPATDKEIAFAKLFIGHLNEIFARLTKEGGGRFQVGGD